MNNIYQLKSLGNHADKEEILSSDEFQKNDFELPVALGKSEVNKPFSVDLSKLHTLLVVGKSEKEKNTLINSIIISALSNKNHNQVMFFIADLNKSNAFNSHHETGNIELIYDNNAVIAMLNDLAKEMNKRNDLLKANALRSISEYNKKHKAVPAIVFIINEFSGLSLDNNDDFRNLAMFGRSCNIHLIITTGLPSVNVITGTIKANFPNRIVFKLDSEIESRVVFDEAVSEKLKSQDCFLFQSF